MAASADALEKAKEATEKVDLSEGARFLEEDFGIRTACGWVHYKFGVELNPAEVGSLEIPAFKKLVRETAAKAYDQRETEYPVMAGLYHFTTRDASGNLVATTITIVPVPAASPAG